MTGGRKERQASFLPSLLACQHRQWTRWWKHDMTLMLNFEEAGAHRHRNAHDDGFTHTIDVIHPSMQCCIKQVVCCFLKGGQHEYTILHFGNAEPGDTQHLTLHSQQ